MGRTSTTEHPAPHLRKRRRLRCRRRLAVSRPAVLPALTPIDGQRPQTRRRDGRRRRPQREGHNELRPYRRPYRVRLSSRRRSYTRSRRSYTRSRRSAKLPHGRGPTEIERPDASRHRKDSSLHARMSPRRDELGSPLAARDPGHFNRPGIDTHSDTLRVGRPVRFLDTPGSESPRIPQQTHHWTPPDAHGKAEIDLPASPSPAALGPRFVRAP